MTGSSCSKMKNSDKKYCKPLTKVSYLNTKPERCRQSKISENMRIKQVEQTSTNCRCGASIVEMCANEIVTNKRIVQELRSDSRNKYSERGYNNWSTSSIRSLYGVTIVGLMVLLHLGNLPTALGQTTTTSGVIGDVNDCRDFPCQNGATCIDGIGAYTCQCPHLYNGTNCENDLSQYGCAVSPCLNGGVCVNETTGDKPYRCNCTAGLKGYNCELNIDECGTNPCQNEAPCIDKVGDYECNCTDSGYNGTHCELDINECDTLVAPCGAGTCFNRPGSYSCSCPTGFIGPSCSDIDECSSNPCLNGGNCTNLQDAYRCTCVSGFTGQNCEADVNYCANVTCPGVNTRCVDQPGGYTCDCKPGYQKTGAGPDCVEINECEAASNLCHNEGTCQDLVNGYKCNCAPGFTGSDCSANIDDCHDDTCLNGASCVDGINNFTCTCVPGYTGSRCETNIDECLIEPLPKCHNQGTCVDMVNNYTCQCGNGWTGRHCEVDIDECVVNPCLNNGDCKNQNGTFWCQCWPDQNKPGFFWTGPLCDISISYCSISSDGMDDPPACKNGATCRGVQNGYECDCAGGFLGDRCGEIDECYPKPCYFNSTCHDGNKTFTCDCVPGSTGFDCSTDINECASNPCGYGQCDDYLNGFDCNCTDTGFNGTYCENNIDDCEVNLCEHDSTCNDLIKDYNCTCFDGYEGKNCEIDINECSPSPCFFNSLCYQKSDQMLYGATLPWFENRTFSYAEAAGYICDCVAGATGVNCETDIDDCVPDDICNNGTCQDRLNGLDCHCYKGFEGDRCQIDIDECTRYQPCQNGATCIDQPGDYQCNCRPSWNGREYVGKNCTFELTACQNNLCQQGSTCKAYLINETEALQDYRCLCADGFTGRYCNISTTMSFDTGSYVKVNLTADRLVELTFRFKTTLRDALLFAWEGMQNSVSNLYLTIELTDRGDLVLGYQNSIGVLTSSRIPNRKFNNEKWHKVTLKFNPANKEITLSVLGSSCGSSATECTLTVTGNQQTTLLPSAFFGRTMDTAHMLRTLSGESYVGCMEDIVIKTFSADGNVEKETSLHLTLSDASVVFTNLIAGCQRTRQCFENTCTRPENGECVDLWNKHRCDCYRPYLGGICNESYVAATFQYNNQTDSRASFSFDASIKSSLQSKFDLSFFIRTRQSNGLVLFFGNYVGNPSMDTFVTLELDGGSLGVRIKFCNFEKYALTSNSDYANGDHHLIKLMLKDRQLHFYVDGHLHTSETVSNGSCFFNAEHVLFGGSLPSSVTTGRRKRDTVTNIMDFSLVTPYKGTIQDIQLDDQYSLQLYPLSNQTLTDLTVIAGSRSNLEEGEKTDPLCDQLSPCDHNSTCSDLFFNDYSCECLPGYRGKNCSELDYCETAKCPEGARCQSLNDGIECIGSANFIGQQTLSLATYKHTLFNTTTVDKFSFQFRTYAMNGDLLRIGDDNHYYKIILKGTYVYLIYKLSSEPEIRIDSMNISFSDAQWYRGNVTEEDSVISFILTDADNKVLSNVTGTKATGSESLNSLVQKASADSGSSSVIQLGLRSYQGCFEEVRIQEYLLPFYRDSDIINNTSPQRFLLQTKDFYEGCYTRPSYCDHSGTPCKHSSTCVADYYSYTCDCDASPGYTGHWCQDAVDYCANVNCGHGKCVSQASGYTCVCFPGFTGTGCDTDVNECAANPCKNNGLCSNFNGTYSCDCSNVAFVGDFCEIANTETCASNLCDQGTCNTITLPGTSTELFNCTCNPGWEGFRCNVTVDYCHDLPCENGGTCSSDTSSQSYTCSCVKGYSGQNCAVNIDDCANNNDCQHGGTCIDGLDAHSCNCTDTRYYTGPTCSENLNECEQLKPCQHGSSCTDHNGPPGFTCNCGTTGYEGVYCEYDINECDVRAPCMNGANCTNTDGDYFCTCTVGYVDKNCQSPNCSAITCNNSGTCQVNPANQWFCNCPEFYEGTYCDIKGPCADDPCSSDNTDRCTQNLTSTPYTYKCHCKPGWEGQNCSSDIDECTVSNDCQNGATCVNEPGSYKCVCPIGYTGTRCQIDIDECAPKPCKNEGYCIDLIGEYECNCTGTGFTDKNCELDEDECEGENPCYNGGTCTNVIGSYTCSCADGFEGLRCDVKSEPVMEENITWYIVGPVVGVVLILIIIGIVWFLMCIRNKRATHGVYSPSRQEMTGSRVELGNVMKKPPLERLI